MPSLSEIVYVFQNSPVADDDDNMLTNFSNRLIYNVKLKRR